MIGTPLMRPRPRAARVPFALLFVACAGAGDETEGAFSDSDRSGVQIAEFDLDAVPAISVVGSPTWAVGLGIDASEPLHEVRSGVFLSETAVAVVDGSLEQIVVRDEDGTTYRIGGEGGGPGEFVYLAQVFAHDEQTIGAYDGRLGRYTLLDSAGRELWAVRVREGASTRIEEFVAPVGDSSLVVAYRRHPRSSGPTATRTRGEVVLVEARHVDTLAYVMGPNSVSLFGLTTDLAVELGRPGMFDDSRPSTPTLLPAHWGLLPDSEGGVWVREYPGPDRANAIRSENVGAESWFHVDSAGIPTVRVVLPARVHALAFRERNVLVRIRDEYSVEGIALFTF